MDYRDYKKGMTKDFFWFKAKNELIEILLNKLELSKRARILNVGAGTGEEMPILNRRGDVYVIDKNPNVIELIPQEFCIEKKVTDVCNMHYPQGMFDLVVAFDVLEHVEDDMLAIKEIYRVLNKNGYFVFTVPAFNCLYSLHDRNLQHFRRYNKRAIKNLLIDFECIELRYWMFTLFMPIALQRMLERRKHESIIHNIKLPKLINDFLYYLLKMENYLIGHGVILPVGITIYGIYRKSK
jgi:SAM-dependent methyltransferase